LNDRLIFVQNFDDRALLVKFRGQGLSDRICVKIFAADHKNFANFSITDRGQGNSMPGIHKKSALKKEHRKGSGKESKKRKLDQIEHVPTLVSSTFNPLEEIDFPRGGSTLTPLERKEAQNEGIRDALFEVSWYL